MNLLKYDKVRDKNGNLIVNNTTSTTIEESVGSRSGDTTVELDRTIWGKHDDGGDIDGHMTVMGDVHIKVIVPLPSDDDEEEGEGYDDDVELDDDGDEEEVDEGGGNLYVEKKLVVDEDIYSPDIYGKTMYLDYNSTKTNILDLILPVGSIIMFNGKTSVPKGWSICDGSNGTPDLRGKFVKGVGSSGEVGSTGGSSTHTLTTNEMPSHNHSATTSINLNIEQDNATVKEEWKDKFFIGYHETYYQVFDTGGDKHYTAETGYESPTDKGISEVPITDLLSAAGGVSGSATATTTIGNTGGGQSFNTEPPYYTLIYIMKIN